MKLVDANVLLYAVDAGAPRHKTAKSWLDAAVRGGETVVLPWLSLLAFVRLSTHRSVYERPLESDQALNIVDSWLAQPAVVTGEPGPRHVQQLRELLAATGNGGNLVNDAHLAALALQYGATVVTFDNDFGRFPRVRWEAPGAFQG